jgi:acetoin utilization deacetylase AcuC-like enzyme
MSTAYLSHPLFLQHEMGENHPECPARLQAIKQHLTTAGYDEQLHHHPAPPAERGAILRVHHADYLNTLERVAPTQGYAQLDPDTAMNPHTLNAALHAAGAGIGATDLVLSGEVTNAFCAVRPPGHHAEPGHAMGFCIFNNIAIAVAHALEVHGLQRVAIIDFDVHHGNGTETMFRHDERVLFCSSFQHPFYPGTRLDSIKPHIIHAPLHAGDGSDAFRTAYSEKIFPAVEAFTPQMLFISAGFDGHKEDAMSGLKLSDEDYIWVSERIVELAARHANRRIVSLLEGGYALQALARCATHHIAALIGACH